jgi:predicted CxxxxCH...CXXCH cytochrome family protein
VEGGASGHTYTCTTCHSLPPTSAHIDGSKDITFDSWVRGTDDSAPFFNDNPGTNDTCSSIYCHGDFDGGSVSNTAYWYKTGQGSGGACGECHKVEGSLVQGSHTKHFAIYGTNCDRCHDAGAAGTSDHHQDAAWKVDGTPTVTIGAEIGTVDNGNQVCSNITCHRGGSADWDLATDLHCKDCHNGHNIAITGSKHDFSATGINKISGLNDDTDNNKCRPCHRDHDQAFTYGAKPLWDRTTDGTTEMTFYPTGGTMNGTVNGTADRSSECLSCHDGTVALENYGGFSSGLTYVTGTYDIGPVLSNDHPVGFTYDNSLATADGALKNPESTSVDLLMDGTTDGTVTGTIDSAMLYSSRIECYSCHNVHRTGSEKFLKKSNTNSALCRTCHMK